jgi:hypothetical protein
MSRPFFAGLLVTPLVACGGAVNPCHTDPSVVCAPGTTGYSCGNSGDYPGSEDHSLYCERPPFFEVTRTDGVCCEEVGNNADNYCISGLIDATACPQGSSGFTCYGTATPLPFDPAFTCGTPTPATFSRKPGAEDYCCSSCHPTTSFSCEAMGFVASDPYTCANDTLSAGAAVGCVLVGETPDSLYFEYCCFPGPCEESGNHGECPAGTQDIVCRSGSPQMYVSSLTCSPSTATNAVCCK